MKLVQNGVRRLMEADSAAGNRWRGVRTRLDGVGLDLPEEIPEGGFVGDAPPFQARTASRERRTPGRSDRADSADSRDPGGFERAIAPLATKADLREFEQRLRTHFDVVAEGLRDDIRLVAAAVVALSERVR